ncbi:hypothetical protein GW17_00015346 [Ensete ventricosum]|nr:hypothetical protein GW17_00015346 [Ensete ventricosum]
MEECCGLSGPLLFSSDSFPFVGTNMLNNCLLLHPSLIGTHLEHKLMSPRNSNGDRRERVWGGEQDQVKLSQAIDFSFVLYHALHRRERERHLDHSRSASFAVAAFAGAAVVVVHPGAGNMRALLCRIHLPL